MNGDRADLNEDEVDSNESSPPWGSRGYGPSNECCLSCLPPTPSPRPSSNLIFVNSESRSSRKFQDSNHQVINISQGNEVRLRMQSLASLLSNKHSLIPPHSPPSHSFDSPQDEIDHLRKELSESKSKCNDLEDLTRRTESELQDFMETSKEMEAEMDNELSSANRKLDDLQKRLEESKGSIDEWKVSQTWKDKRSRSKKACDGDLDKGRKMIVCFSFRD